jgi:Flp pilus assembly protein TadG
MKIFKELLRRKGRGQGLVEFALVLPMLLLLIFGIVEAGRFMLIYSMVMASSREAARYGSAAGSISTALPTARFKDCSGMRAAARRIGALAGIQDGDISIVYDQGPSTATIGHCNSTFTLSGGSGARVNQGDRVVVQVVANFRPLIPGITRFTSFPITSITRRTLIKDVEVGGTPPPPVPPKVSFATSSQVVAEDGGTAILRVQLNSASSKAVTIPFTVSGSATEGVSEDFSITTPSPVFISPGDLSVDIVIQLNNDVMDEFDETIVIAMETPTNADKIAPDEHTITISDEDEPPYVSFTASGQSQPEDVNMVINLQLSAPSGKEITVNYTVAGTASEGADADFTLTSSPLTIPPESTSVSILASVIDDPIDEYDETIIVTLGELVNASEGNPAVHVATIIDNDLPPLVSFVWDESSMEESVGSMVVQLQLSSISYKDISVPFSVSGDAELDSDYSISASPVFFPAGSESAYITITVFEDDDITELDEEIIISLLAADNAALGTPDVHTATIGKEATTPSVRFSSSSQTVSEGATNPKINIRVQLDKAATRDVSVPFSVGGTAVRGTDFTVTSSPVVIPAGGAFVNITLTLMNDLLYEADETIVLTMGTPDNAFKGSPNVHTVTVTDDDAFPTVSFASGTQTVSENAGTRPIQIQLSAASGLEVQVPFTVSGTASQLQRLHRLGQPGGDTGRQHQRDHYPHDH